VGQSPHFAFRILFVLILGFWGSESGCLPGRIAYDGRRLPSAYCPPLRAIRSRILFLWSANSSVVMTPISYHASTISS